MFGIYWKVLSQLSKRKNFDSCVTTVQKISFKTFHTKAFVT